MITQNISKNIKEQIERHPYREADLNWNNPLNGVTA
jgi:hypothetical protein